MALTVRTAEYYYLRIANDQAKAYELLARLATDAVNLLAFSAVPYGSTLELTLFPDKPESLVSAAVKEGWNLTGPQHAILIQGDDHLGATADIHRCLNSAGVQIYASSGLTDGHGHFGYVIYFREGDYREAVRALDQVMAAR